MIVILALLLLAAACEDAEKQPPPELPDTQENKVEILRPIRLTAKARIPENDPSLTSVEVHDSRLVFNYSRKPTITLDKDHVVSGVKGGGYSRRIVAVVSRTDKRVEVTTKYAHITDLILDGSFHIRQNPSSTSWQDGIASRTSSLQGKVDLLKTPKVLFGLQCGTTLAKDVGLLPSLNVDPDFEFEVDIVPSGFWGKLNHARIAFTGTVDIAVEQQTSKNGGAIFCTIDMIDVLYPVR